MRAISRTLEEHPFLFARDPEPPLWISPGGFSHRELRDDQERIKQPAEPAYRVSILSRIRMLAGSLICSAFRIILSIAYRLLVVQYENE